MAAACSLRSSAPPPVLPPEPDTPLNRARAHVEASVRVHERVREQARTLVHIATAICEALQSGGRVRFFDGAAGGDARRWVADLTPRLHGQYAHQLIAPSGAHTAGSAAAPRFGRAVTEDAGAGKPEGTDVAVGMAVGPAAESVLNELRRAGEEGATAIVFAGQQAEHDTDFCERAVVIPSPEPVRVHEALVLCRHIVVDLVGDALEVPREQPTSASRG